MARDVSHPGNSQDPWMVASRLFKCDFVFHDVAGRSVPSVVSTSAESTAAATLHVFWLRDKSNASLYLPVIPTKIGAEVKERLDNLPSDDADSTIGLANIFSPGFADPEVRG